MKHNYQQVSKATGATLITFSAFVIILDSTWIWFDLYLDDFPYYSRTWGVGIICGVLSLTAGSLGVSVSCNDNLAEFFSKFGPTAIMGNVAGSIAVLCYGYITFCVGMHLYYMNYVTYLNSLFWGSFIAVVVCEWIFMTLIMALSFFQANFFGCTCCCIDPTGAGTIEPVDVAPVALNYPQYPVAQAVSYDHVQKQQIMIPIDEQTAQVHGQFEPNPAPAEA